MILRHAREVFQLLVVTQFSKASGDLSKLYCKTLPACAGSQFGKLLYKSQGFSFHVTRFAIRGAILANRATKCCRLAVWQIALQNV